MKSLRTRKVQEIVTCKIVQYSGIFWPTSFTKRNYSTDLRATARNQRVTEGKLSIH